jgi:hypothetical protein
VSAVNPSARSLVAGFSVVLATSRNLLPAVEAEARTTRDDRGFAADDSAELLIADCLRWRYVAGGAVSSVADAGDRSDVAQGHYRLRL